MARIEDIPQPTRDAVLNLPCRSFETFPFVSGPPLAQRRIAIVSTPNNALKTVGGRFLVPAPWVV